MTFDEYFNIVVASAVADWNVVPCLMGNGPSFRDQFTVSTSGDSNLHNIEIESHHLMVVHRNDLQVAIAAGLSFEEDFEEPWANKFADPKASGSFVDFFFGSTLIYRDRYVTVDGGRAHLPLPRIAFDEQREEVEAYTVSSRYHAFMQMLNQLAGTNLREYVSYFERAGLTVTNDEWPSRSSTV